MDDGDVAGEEIGKLGQEERRAEVVGQALVEGRPELVLVEDLGEQGVVDLGVALAAAGGDDHVGAREQRRVALEAGVVQGEARGMDAGALPGLHLSLIAAARNLAVEIERHQRMHGVGVKARAVDHGLRAVRSPQRGAVAVAPFGEAGRQPDAGDQHRPSGLRAHGAGSGLRPSRAACAAIMSRNSGEGNAITRKVRRASHTAFPASATRAAVMA